MKKERLKIQIKHTEQAMVFKACCITVVLVGFFVVIMTGMRHDGRGVLADMQDDYAIEQQADLKQSGPKYTLKDPEEKIKENITSVVTEETDAQKSSRLEDIMGVLSSEISESDSDNP